VRGYISEIYRLLRVSDKPKAERERAAFEVLSKWWWEERFAPFL
jgi:hypothetical protein